MTIATSMRGLTDDILSSFEDRANKLSELREEARALLQDSSTSRSEASRRMRRQLAESNADRVRRVSESRNGARNLVKGFRSSRKDSGDQLRQELAQNEKNRKQQVGGMLDDFQTSRHETSAQLRNDLAQGKAKVKSKVKGAIKDYQSSRRTMGAHLKKDLARKRHDRKAEVEGIRDDFRKVQAEVRADLEAASEAWKGMASAIGARRNGGKTLPTTAAETPSPIAPNLKEKLLAIIKQHVGGITLSEVAETLGVATVVLGKAAKTLREQGKVRKEGNIYFPVTA